MIASGRVKDGKVVVEGVELAEGSQVTILAPDGESSFELSEGEQKQLLEAIEQARTGDWIAGQQLLDELRSAE